MKLIYKVTILTIALGALMACKKDKESPEITIVEPAEHSHYKWGEEVHIDAIFTDDKGLKSFEVTIGDESGTHDHDFNWEEGGDIDGLEYEFHEHFMVPDSAASERWVHFTVTDEEDKTTTKKWMLHFEQ